jgi:hypothetical protein
VVADGTSIWQFINSWAKISKGCLEMTRIQSFERWFPNGIQLPIRFPFTIEQQNNLYSNDNHKEDNPNPLEVISFPKREYCKTKIQSQFRGWYKEHIFFASTFNSHLEIYYTFQNS